MADDLVDAVAAVAAEAGALAMARWGTDFARWEKAGGSPVCEVDLAVDALLRDRLSALLPDAGWLSEETADSPARLACERLWVVDPIDGTRDYVRGRRGWCVSVALVEAGRPMIGVLDAPARGERWRAVAGEGASLGDRRLRASDQATVAGARMPADVLPRDLRTTMVAVAQPNSIALRIATVAAGDADVVATSRWGNEWDVAAAVLLAQEAGATASDAAGAPLAFNQPQPQAYGLLVAPPALHAAMLARSQQQQ